MQGVSALPGLHTQKVRQFDKVEVAAQVCVDLGDLHLDPGLRDRLFLWLFCLHAVFIVLREISPTSTLHSGGVLHFSFQVGVTNRVAKEHKNSRNFQSHVKLENFGNIKELLG